jgi:hypothetical protein
MPLNTDFQILVVESPSDREIELLPPPTVSTTGPRVKFLEELEPISLDELLQSQCECLLCQDLASRIGQKGMESFYLNENGSLCYCGSDREPSGVRYVAPAELRERILVPGHSPALACHPGSTIFANTVARHWFLPSLTRDCVSFVRRCTSFQAKVLKRRPKHTIPLQRFPPKEPLSFVAMNILGLLPKTKQGNRFVLVMCDRFSKLVQTVALPSQTAEVISRVFVERWVAVYGIPEVILTDNGSNFGSRFFKIVTNILVIHQVFTTAYHTTTNGQAERMNAVIVDGINHCISKQEEWDEYLATTTFAYNNKVHSTTGFTPF